MGRPDYPQHRIIIKQQRNEIKQLAKNHHGELKRLRKAYLEKIHLLQEEMKKKDFEIAYWQAWAEILEPKSEPERKRGPKGPRPNVTVRRAIIKILRNNRTDLRSICDFLQDKKFPLPSKQLQDGYGRCAWIQWYFRAPRSVSRQLSMDAKRAKEE